MTLNEARASEDRDYIEGGDVLVVAANSSVFDIKEGEWFIPGQKPPTPSTDAATVLPPAEEDEPDDDGDDAPTAKVKTRLNAIANSLASGANGSSRRAAILKRNS